ncbi:hypothetical protein Tco_1232025 [Tanacetum coccineum]
MGQGVPIGYESMKVDCGGRRTRFKDDVREGSVYTDIWGWMYGVYTQRSLNTLTLIVVKGIHGSDELGNSLSKLKDTIWSNPSEEVSSEG